jgi:hypothetical protein
MKRGTHVFVSLACSQGTIRLVASAEFVGN